jgi:CheY-like chemotaxis protein/nitrogen-specific signal transduction histidine kinase
MRPEDFRPDDLFAQIQSLVDGLQAERQARERAEAADKAKSELMALASYELRTPMDAIISMTELLLASPLDGTQWRYAETLQKSARGLLAVLNDILDFSQLESGQYELDLAPFDLHDLVQTVAANLQARASEKGLASGVDIGASCPRMIRGDAECIRQILTNLVDNALKFTSEGSVRLHASARAERGKLTLRFDVTDTGAGLSKAEQAWLFKPHVDARRAGASHQGGTGLGLAIARRLAELMGGEIGCESVPGQGSLFFVTIPGERATTERSSAKEAKEAQPAGPLSGHILVVEDNAVNRMLIGAYLDEFGLSYEMVDNGGAAIMCLASNSYDLVLMDIMMPELDGVETSRRIRKLQGPSAEVPIVALSAKAVTDEGEEYLAAGMDAYVAKPIRGRELYAALAPFLAVDEGLEDDATPAKRA